MNEQQPVVAFDTDDPEFTRGVEVGQISERVRAGECGPFMVHARNAEMMIRIGEENRMICKGQDWADEWIRVEFY